MKIQIPIAVICMLMLDLGQLAGVCAVAMMAHWLGTFLVMFRRPHNPTHFDLAFIRWAFLAVFPIVCYFQHVIPHIGIG